MYYCYYNNPVDLPKHNLIKGDIYSLGVSTLELADMFIIERPESRVEEKTVDPRENDASPYANKWKEVRENVQAFYY